VTEERDPLTKKVIGAAIEVHRALGPGLLESAYEECLCHELHASGLSFKRQVGIPVEYKTVHIDCGFRVDLLVEGTLVMELKAVEKVLPIHHAQVLTYMRLGGFSHGLLINFNEKVLKDGIKRFVL
jgi:GxxExxY protein